MSLAFKKFTFFQQQEEKGHSYPSGAACYCEGPGCLYVGCDNGSLHVLDERYSSAASFPAHGQKIFQLFVLQTHGILVTIGSEEPGISSTTLKIWEVEQLAQASAPTPTKTFKVFSSKQYTESQVTALAVSGSTPTSAVIAVGLGSGHVYLLRADLSAKGKVVHSSKINARPEHGDLWAITGLHFTEPASGKEPSSLWVVTEAQTLSYTLADLHRTILDQQGAQAPRCSLVRDGHLLVGQEDALYEYAHDTRAGCSAFPGHKQQLALLRRYVVVATNDTPEEGASSSTVAITDLRNKLTAGSFSLSHVRHVISAFGAVTVYMGSGRLVTLREVELSVQLDTLFKRSLYKLALQVADAHGVDQALRATIHQRWGDHLYAKGEHDAAMAQYQETLGQLEPSYVIRRYLDAQRIHALTAYLEALHERGLASADHTTLLLNCYTKLKHVDKLDAFVHKEQAVGPDGQPLPNFDLESAYKVLKSAGYYNQALAVAAQADQWEWTLDLLLDDMHDYSMALAYLDTLSRPQIATALKRYGRLLIAARPEDTTRCLMDLCIAGDDTHGNVGYVANVADFAHLYTEQPSALIVLCEFVLNSQGPGQPQPAHERMLYHTLLELYLQEKLPDEPEELKQAAASSAQQHRLTPRQQKAVELLQRGWQPHLAEPVYSADHALVLCRLHRLKEGLVFLYDKMRLHKEVLQVYMEHSDFHGLIGACARYGDPQSGGDPQLWAAALEYFAAQPGDCSGEICDVLARVEEGGWLAPLQVLQVLATNPRLPVQLVKGYVARHLERQVSEVQTDREAIAKLQAETSSMRSEVAKMRGQPRVFQNSRCAATGQPLELPVVHFLCGHSFNQRSLGDGDGECPLCAPEFRRVLDIRRNMRAGALQQDRFFTELREAGDGFAVVAEHFGRGLMNMTAAAVQQQQQHGV